MMVRRLAAALAWNSYPAVPVNLIGDSRRSGASRRTRSVALAAIFYLAVPPAGVVAQVATTALAEFVPPLSFGVSWLDDTGLRNLVATSAPETAERTSFSTGEVLDPIPKTSSITFQPTYVRRTDGTYQAYVQLKPVIVVESGLPLFTRIQWPIPEVDDENGPTNAGVGDLTWLTLLLLGARKRGERSPSARSWSFRPRPTRRWATASTRRGPRSVTSTMRCRAGSSRSSSSSTSRSRGTPSARASISSPCSPS